LLNNESTRQAVPRFIVFCARGLNRGQSCVNARVITVLHRSQLLQLRQRLRQLLPGLGVQLAQLTLATHAILDGITQQKDRKI